MAYPMRKSSFLQFYPMVAVAAALIAGVVVGGRCYGGVAEWLWLAVAVAALSLGALCRRSSLLLSAGLLAAVLCLGAWRSSVAERSVRAELPVGDVEYDAIVMSEPQVHGRTLRCDLLLTSASPMLRVKASVLRDTVVRRYERLHLGDGLRACSTLEQPHSFGASRFDYGRYLRVNGFQAQTFIYYSKWTKTRLSLGDVPLADRLRLRMSRLRNRLLATADTTLFAYDAYAVLAAVTLGDRSHIDKHLRASYTGAGAAHVLALSGMHLAVIYMMLSALLLGFRRSVAGELLLLVLVWTFVMLAGMSPSLLRSAAMLTVYATLRLAHRDGSPVNVLAFTAVAMLIANPLMLYDAGFQLSFLSLLGILVLLPPTEKLLLSRLSVESRVGRWLSSLLLLPIAAQIATAPLVAFYFGQLPAYFILTNLVTAPTIAAVLPLALAYFLTAAVAPLHTAVGQLLSALLNMQNAALEWIATLPGASIEGLSPTAAEVVVAYAAVVAVWLLLRRYVANKQLGDLQVDYS